MHVNADRNGASTAKEFPRFAAAGMKQPFSDPVSFEPTQKLYSSAPSSRFWKTGRLDVQGLILAEEFRV